MRGSGLVRRLVRAGNDPGKERIRMWLMEIDDAQLRSRLGLSLEDIAVLRASTPRNLHRRKAYGEVNIGTTITDGP
jgi:hypothetical protein